MPTEADFEALLATPDDALLDRLAIQITTMLAAVDESPSERRNRARVFLQRERDRLRDAVCGSLVVTILRSRGRAGDRALLAAAIADFLLPLIGYLPAVTVAALVVREGLDSFCATWTDDRKQS